MNVVVHCHSSYSYDSLTSPKLIIDRAVKLGINSICITDHDTIEGSLEAVEYAKSKYHGEIEVIPGVEYFTECGDLVLFDINEEISFSNVYDLIAKAKERNGLILLPHPFKSHRDLDKIAPLVDLIEIFNARCTKEENSKSAQLALDLNKPGYVASDAHFLSHCFLCINSFTVDTPSDTKDILLNSPRKFTTNYSNEIFVHLSQIIKSYKRFNIKLFLASTYFIAKALAKKVMYYSKDKNLHQ